MANCTTEPAAVPIAASRPAFGFGFSHGPAANSAVAPISSQGTRARKDGLSSASKSSAPASAPIAEMTAMATASRHMVRMSFQ